MVIVLGVLVIAASMDVLITNQRTYTAQSAQIQGQDATRAALDVLTGELRELSTRGGDLLSMGTQSMTFRAMRKFGLVCSADTTTTGTTGQPLLTVLKVGQWFDTKDSVFVFADNNESTAKDDYWIPAQVSQRDTTGLCGLRKAEQLIFAGQKAAFTADSVRPGAPIRSFVQYKYGLIAYGGAYYLGRSESGGAAVPLVGPLRSGDGVSFQYLDSLDAVTGTPTDVRQIVVTVRSPATVRNATGGLVSDSVTSWIYTRN